MQFGDKILGNVSGPGNPLPAPTLDKLANFGESSLGPTTLLITYLWWKNKICDMIFSIKNFSPPNTLPWMGSPTNNPKTCRPTQRHFGL